MAQLIRGGWPYRHFPNAPFQMNRWSPQSKGVGSWWPTLGSAGRKVLRDYSGYGYDATFPGGGNDPAWAVDAVRGHALNFDGAGDYVSHDRDSGGATQLTITAWIRPAALNGWRTIYIEMYGIPSYKISFHTDGTVLEGNFRDGEPGTTATVNGITNLNVGELYFVGVAFDSINNAHEIFLNGRSDGTDNTAINAITAAWNNSKIGAQIGGAARPWSGIISEVRLYNSILTPSEHYEQYANRWELYRPKIRRFVGWRAPVAGNILQIATADWSNVGQLASVAEASIGEVAGVTAN